MHVVISFVFFLVLFNGAESEVPADSVVPVKPLDPIPQYHFQLSDLPPPYNTTSVQKDGKVVSMPNDAFLNVPRGFKVHVFAQNLTGPRWLQLTPNGDVLVAEMSENRLILLKDANKDGVADTYSTFGDVNNALNLPFGMSFDGDKIYVGNTDSVRRYSFNSTLEGKGEKILDLPGESGHITRNVLVSNKTIYVSIGSSENVVDEGPPRASVQVCNLDGTGNRTFAFGLRNPNGLEFHPITQKLYTTVNERDELGDDLVPDYFTEIQQDDFFGYPFVYLSPNNPDPRMNNSHPEWTNKTKTPEVLFQAHSAALGMKFYDKTSFPARYHNGAFVAFHGSWNRAEGTGYKIVFVPFDPTTNKPTGSYEDFVTGFLLNTAIPQTWARPVGLLVLPDGSLLIADDGNGKIYRVYYEDDNSTSSTSSDTTTSVTIPGSVSSDITTSVTIPGNVSSDTTTTTTSVTIPGNVSSDTTTTTTSVTIPTTSLASPKKCLSLSVGLVLAIITMLFN